MDCWEALYMYAYRKQQILIEEQQVNDTNDIFDLEPYTHCMTQQLSSPLDTARYTRAAKVRSI